MVLTLANGKNLPLVGLGTSTGAPVEQELSQALDDALNAGYRHIDTALVYNNERIIGKVLQKWFSSGKLKRQDVFITTKLPMGGVYPEGVEIHIKQSLENLQIDQVDLYLVHFPVGYYSQEGRVVPKIDADGRAILRPKTDHVGIWKKMEEQVKLGRARYIGLSNYNKEQIQIVLKNATIKPACLQTEVHLALQQRPLVEFCHQNNITVVGFQPLGAPDFNKRMAKWFSTFKGGASHNFFSNEIVQGVAKKYSKSVAQIMLRFSIQSGVSPIPKSMNKERLRENLDVEGFELEEEDMATLRGLDVGETARISTFRNVILGVEKHPDYPFELPTTN